MAIESVSVNFEGAKAFLEKKFKSTSANRSWLSEILSRNQSEMEADLFPYQVKEKGKAEIGTKCYVPNERPTLFPAGVARKPVFLLNIPLGFAPNDSNIRVKVQKLLTRLQRESFSTNTLNSKRQALNKLAVVIGANQIQSIDSKVNRLFIESIREIPLFQNLPYRIEGFFSVPEWEKNNLWKKKATVKILPGRIYDRKKAFLVLKCIDPKKAEKIRKILEGGPEGVSKNVKSQIPYQKIREHIKDSASTLFFAKKFSKEGFKSPVYFTTFDGDCKGLRNTEGYFTLLEKQILHERKKDSLPHIISLGYQLEDTALAIPRLAVKCDMLVREAMNEIIPGSVYMPEPGTAYLLSDVLEGLKKFSFLGKTGPQTFESRRAISNGIKSELFEQSKIVFLNKPSLITQMPNRMSSTVAEKYKKLKAADIKKAEVLRALRKVSQVHFTPLAWAHYVYEGLPSDIKKGEHIYGHLSKFLSKIFNVFDPIGAVYTFNSSKKFSLKKFDTVFSIYEKYSQALIEGERNDKITGSEDPQLVLKKSLKEHKDFIQTRFSILLDAKAELVKLGMEDEWIEKIIDAAKASGLALYKELKRAAKV